MNKIFSFSVSLLGTSSIALASIPFGIGSAAAQEEKAGDAADLGVMSISLKDAIQPNFGFQGALQGAGTPNQAGIGGFLPLAIGDNSVFFLDAQANANFADYNNYSSIINTTVAGTTISTSSRLGYRWLNSDRSWMFGVNAGYDSRPMATGAADTGVNARNSSTVFYQQVAAGLEAVSNTWNFNAYALVPFGTVNYQLNIAYLGGYGGGALDTYGLDVGYAITPDFKASVGYYYQDGDFDTADGSGVLGRLSYNISNGLTAGVNLSYDQAFETRFSADLKYRFGGNGNKTASEKKAWQTPVMQALTETLKHRDVRAHDATHGRFGCLTDSKHTSKSGCEYFGS
ncbi:outer membrane protein [Synechococcus lacustris]|uniref:outer membrane protein n=1 Tax=Synechococcus lacustris TaxID=2116544 RepID=UPI0020CC8AEE|nr:carbamoyl-phosphate synthase [Synechococcus lacustris]